MTVVALTAAASPGRLHQGDPGAWLAGIVIVVAVVALIAGSVVLLLRHHSDRVPRERRPVGRVDWQTMAVVAVVIALLAWASVHLLDGRAAPPAQSPAARPTPRAALPRVQHSGGGGSVDFGPWILLLVVAALVALLVWVVAHQLRQRHTVASPEVIPGNPLTAAIEAALIDLDAEQDPRRAVIKAYARTEAVLRANGLPRHPAEAPLEYLARVLLDLGAQAGAVDRLIELYERAAFSTAVIGPEMRDEAVAVFHALRDSLLEPSGGQP